MRRALLASLTSGLLAACASVQSDRDASGAESTFISGRLSVRVEATSTTPVRALAAGFDLQGSPTSGQLNLTGGLGAVLAQARWSTGWATLTTSDGVSRDYPDLDALTLDLLGESLPVPALFDWLRGRPWPGAPSLANPPSMPAGFEQAGWQVNTAELHEHRIVAQRARAPAVTVKARIEP